eukprot:m51a1_g3192 hypothetical protein (400) ;mRNA; f:445012-446519
MAGVVVTCQAPVNIALIKYWGKRDAALNLPLNSSLSVTIDSGALRTTTTVAVSPEWQGARLWLNGREEDLSSGKASRTTKCIAAIREMAKGPQRDWGIRACSENSFPTAAGLASSASGFACLVAALARALGVVDAAAVTRVARLGSGSACRSLFGGFVLWDAGHLADGTDSIATQVFPETHWPELRVLVLVADGKKKDVGSTDGMNRTARTSELMKARLDCVPRRIDALRKAIASKDFASLAEVTMRDSNQFHAVCLDTYPPILYLSDTSRAVIRIITALNEMAGRPVAAYTFDAGPNPVVFALESEMARVLRLMLYYFPPLSHCPACFTGDVERLVGHPLTRDGIESVPRPSDEEMAACGTERYPDRLSRFISARVGGDPLFLGPEASLLGPEGLPKA